MQPRRVHRAVRYDDNACIIYQWRCGGAENKRRPAPISACKCDVIAETADPRTRPGATRKRARGFNHRQN
jgi:hypothetical protein